MGGIGRQQSCIRITSVAAWSPDQRMKLRIGLIGLGNAWTSRHRPALRVLHDRFDVRAVYSSVAKLAENVATEFQADPMDGYRALLNRWDIDAVLVLERTWLDWLPVLAAAEAGKAVYWAGDLDFNPAPEDPLRAAIERSGVAFMVEFPRRFAPATLRLRELIATHLGAPRLVICRRRLQPSGNRTNHLPPPADVLRRELLELIDWCRYVVDREPLAVSSGGSITTDEVVFRSLQFEFPATPSLPPVLAQLSSGNYIQTNWHEAIGFRPPSDMEICCEHGVAFIDLPTRLVWFDEAGRHVESLESERSVGEQLLSQFHRSVTSLVRNIGDLDDAYRAASLLAAAVDSERLGRRIDV